MRSASECVAQRIRRHNGRGYALFRDGKGHGVDGFFGQAGLAGHLAQGFGADIRNTDVAQAHGQAHRGAEAQHFVQFFRGGVFQHQLHQRAKGDLFAVQIGMGFFQCGQAIVDGMGCR